MNCRSAALTVITLLDLILSLMPTFYFLYGRSRIRDDGGGVESGLGGIGPAMRPPQPGQGRPRHQSKLRAQKLAEGELPQGT